ncbi:hypothetical protein OG921_04845 [Aldersonia sp. NBC_00410]|uniref:SCO6880 family protein n=1 Tax=Aldersonia sp. NBC_00410 TaxID=2975954 RepID=UPI00225AC8FA|nr:SCO6880 family protein [Aldersonia sp. NBC_00410]MCX5042499.1 hypothetical protein [Aldersonia sp. NBC_00410]
MTATSTPPQNEGLLYTGWTKPRSAGLFGMTWATTLTCGVLVVVSMLTMMFAGPKIGLGVLVVSGLIVTPLVWTREGRSGYEVSSLRVQWHRGRGSGSHIYRSGVFSEIPGGKTRLPGLLAPTKLYEGTDIAGWTFGMIHMPATHCYTVVLRAWPSGDEPVDQSVINGWVAEWGIALASMGQTSDVPQVAVVIDTIPETGNKLLGAVRRLIHPDAPELASETLYQSAEMHVSETVGLECRLAVTFTATTDARRKDPAEQAVEIGRRLPGLCAAMQTAGVALRPMPAAEVIAFVRRSFDPAAQLALEHADLAGNSHGLDWSDAGPVAAEERFDHYLHDGAQSVTWEMDTAPIGAVDEGVLRRLLAPNAEIPRKRVALFYRPHTAGDAVKIVDMDFRDALAAEQSGKGLAAASASIKVEHTGRAREEQARGHGLVRFGLLITVTEPLDGDLPAVEAITRDLAVQCRLKIRRTYRYQAAAFAASLGVGVILPDHATVPNSLAG